MALDYKSTGENWNDETPAYRKDYTKSMCLVLTKINKRGRKFDAEKLYQLVNIEYDTEDKTTLKLSVLDTMARIIRNNKVG